MIVLSGWESNLSVAAKRNQCGFLPQQAAFHTYGTKKQQAIQYTSLLRGEGCAAPFRKKPQSTPAPIQQTGIFMIALILILLFILHTVKVDISKKQG